MNATANSTMGVTDATITDAVAKSFSSAHTPRVAELLPLLVRHAHAFIREGNVTHAEWRAALGFLTECAKMTDEVRNEFTLLSDVLGVSSLVDLQASPLGATPGSVLGPFHNQDSHFVDNGANLIGTQAGEPVLFSGQVCDANGAPIAGATIDFWQNAANALYPAQDAAQDPHNLRGKMKCDADGRFSLRTVKPQPYTVPYDGPVGALLTASARDCWRPAHFHFIITAAGYLPLVTEIFPSDSAYLDSDAVFGVRDPLIVAFETIDDAGESARAQMPKPFSRAHFNFRLVKALHT
jgi:hydroxyquinol 1,2-dioxygenase